MKHRRSTTPFKAAPAPLTKQQDALPAGIGCRKLLQNAKRATMEGSSVRLFCFIAMILCAHRRRFFCTRVEPSLCIRLQNEALQLGFFPFRQRRPGKTETAQSPLQMPQLNIFTPQFTPQISPQYGRNMLHSKNKGTISCDYPIRYHNI